jgi:hypothetical protein
MKHMLDLGAFDCRWPVKGEGADTMFCAEPTLKSPYCPTHFARAYHRAPPTKEQRQAAREAPKGLSAPAGRRPRGAQVKAMGAL